MLSINETFQGHLIQCKVIKMGEDINMMIEGGDIPHIGAVALGIAFQMPHNINKMTASVSLLTVPGHKEDDVVLKYAKRLVQELGVTSVVTCGIHIQNITFEEIQELMDVIDDLVTRAIEQLK